MFSHGVMCRWYLALLMEVVGRGALDVTLHHIGCGRLRRSPTQPYLATVSTPLGRLRN